MNTTSRDGTTIAFERTGDGPALVLVGGAFCDRTARASGTPLAARLADHFTVYSYDRRGRGDSTDTPPYAFDRELDDLDAVIRAAGGSAFVYGISSGGLLALDAAARGLAIPKLVAYEPPLIFDPARIAMLEPVIAELDAATRRSDAVDLFFGRVMQMPEPAVAQMRTSPFRPALEALAHTLAYDVRFTARGPARLADAATIRASVTIVSGGASPPWMRASGEHLARAIRNGRHETLEGQTHDVDPAVLATALIAAFSV